jgi:hypothetical protein
MSREFKLTYRLCTAPHPIRCLSLEHVSIGYDENLKESVCLYRCTQHNKCQFTETVKYTFRRVKS